ncbi:MAG: TonB-dependent receptor plug domain-containing protein, partial [Bacteroidia bacterium]
MKEKFAILSLGLLLGLQPSEIKAQNFPTQGKLGDTTRLSEVVVVGYGSRKITKVSGAISTVKAAEIEKLQPVRVEDALQGRASGVSIINGGSPGSKPTVFVRGIPSFSGTDPLVIIDGVPQTLTDF